MPEPSKKFAVVTGASTGIGLELAKCCAQDGANLLIVADEAKIEDAAEQIRRFGGEVQTVQADLATIVGVDALLAAIGGRSVDLLLANAGRGLGEAFLDQDFDDLKRVIDTNVMGTVYLLHKIANRMRRRGSGKILITGSIAGFIPGTFQAIYNATKAFLDSFSIALRAELKDSGVSVTCLMPGATETEFFKRAGMTDTKVGSGKKDDPADVARIGYDAMMAGEADVVSGWKNKVQVAASNLIPDTVLAEQHRKSAEPGSGRR
jgi:short-subunit dehydrogenase